MVDLDVDAAVTDLKERTLSNLPGEMARLVYLASTRDYNTGQYFHDGLAAAFSGPLAGQALARCHQETFSHLALTSLQELVYDLSSYVASTRAQEEIVLQFWAKAEPYRVTVPADADSLVVKLFLSNVKIALAILASGRRSRSQQSA